MAGMSSFDAFLGKAYNAVSGNINNLKLSGTGTIDEKVAKMVATRATGSLTNQKGLGKQFYSSISKSGDDISSLDAGFMKALKKGNLGEAEQIAKNVGGDTMNAYAEASRRSVMYQNNLKNAMSDSEVTPEVLKDIMGMGEGFTGKAKYAGKAAQAYFTEEGKMASRIGTAAGAYAVGAVGARALSGGSLSRNSSGERDIAGVPFF